MRVPDRKRGAKATDWLLSHVTVVDNAFSSSNVTEDLWIHKHAPQTELDLTIHRDKLKEVMEVLQNCFVSTQPTIPGGPILLLFGPPGSGKTSALRVAIRSLFPNNTINWMEWSDESLVADDVGQLEEFVMQTGRYGVITSEIADAEQHCASPCVILLKNLPVSLATCYSRFHSLLRFHATRALHSCLLVLSLTSSTTARESILSERLLCPASLRMELNVRRVEFNPVAPTLLLKTLSRIANLECQRSGRKVPPRDALQRISNGCAGDLRAAINQLQFFCQSGTRTGRFSHPSELHPDVGRDTGLSLFRALGKILYNKRQTSDTNPSFTDKQLPKLTEKTTLPPHLMTWERPPLTFDLEEILEQCQMSGDQIMCWLHENFLDFMPHMSATEWVSQHLSWSDSYLSGGMNWRLGLTPAADWNATDSLGSSTRPFACTANRHYGALVVAHSVLLSHGMKEQTLNTNDDSCRTHSRGFHPLRSPAVQDAWKVAEQRRDALADLLSHKAQSFGPYELDRSLIAGWGRLLLDWLPLAMRIKPVKDCLDTDLITWESVTKLCLFNQATRAGTKRPWPVGDRKHAHTNQTNTLTEITWMCPSEAALEGDALPIEEDASDEDATVGRGR